MFISKTSENEFYSSLEENMDKIYRQDEIRDKDRKVNILISLNHAVELLKSAGFNKEAQVIEMLSDEFSASDDAMEGLTSDKMLKNLEQKGWVFNAEDMELLEEHELEKEPEDTEDEEEDLVIEFDVEIDLE